MSQRLTTLVCLFCVFGLADQGFSDQWSDAMVETKEVDFGVIATGSEAKKYVKITNIYDTVVQIGSVGTTCGCSAATPGKQTLEPGESTLVEVKMNTHKFRQKKDSNLIIRFTRPRITESRVPIHAYIRTDVVFDPGAIRFGDVELGEGGKASVDIAYAGRPDWAIEDVRVPKGYLKASLSEPKRSGGNIRYRLSMALAPTAKAGPLRDVVTLVTNDKTNPYVPLMVEGTVVPDIILTPPTVNVRPLAPGQTTRFQIVLRGKKPFEVADVGCKGMADSFAATVRPAASRVHQVPIEFTAPNRPGRFSETLLVKIAERPDPIRFTVTGTITN